MGLLEAMIVKFYVNTRGCKYQDTEWEFDDREDNGRITNLGAGRAENQSSLQLSTPEHGKTDRTAWGSYRENAPPILPADTCVPGFEDELWLLGRRAQHGKLDDDSTEGDDCESSPSDGDDDNQVDNVRSGEDDSEGRNAATRPTRRSRDGRAASVASGIIRSFPTDWLQYGNLTLSSLFGSTTRPATTTTRTVPRAGERVRSHSSTLRMASKTHIWISLWFLLTAPVIFWDATYCFMRPRSFKGGDLHWIWQPYEIYQEVDYVYGVDAYNRGDGFASAQSFLNVVETLLNLYYVYAQHILASPAAPVIGFAAGVMTLSKTVLYWAQEYFCGGCAIGHNDLWTLLWFWIIPNGLWLIVPTFITRSLYRDVAAGLRTASKVDAAKKQ